MRLVLYNSISIYIKNDTNVDTSFYSTQIINVHSIGEKFFLIKKFCQTEMFCMPSQIPGLSFIFIFI